jgi:hypothetical protein
MKVSKITKEMILAIAPGETETFVCDTPIAASNGQRLIFSYVKPLFLPTGVRDYKTSREANVLKVEAVRA